MRLEKGAEKIEQPNCCFPLKKRLRERSAQALRGRRGTCYTHGPVSMDKSENRGRTRASTKRLDLTGRSSEVALYHHRFSRLFILRANNMLPPKVVGGQNLGGASCYCELKYLPRSEKHAWAKTTKVAKTTNPAWNETWFCTAPLLASNIPCIFVLRLDSYILLKDTCHRWGSIGVHGVGETLLERW